MRQRKDNDCQLGFELRALMVADAMEQLEYTLTLIGMAGDSHFIALKSEFIKHMAKTARYAAKELVQ